MLNTPKTIYNVEELQRFLAAHIPALYVSSKTSTVIPYDHLKTYLGETLVVDLSQLPKHMELTEEGNLIVRGGVTWTEARAFLQANGRGLKTYPTEILAAITAGVATSCTGERSFGYGNLRKQIKRIKYLSFEGKEIELFENQNIKDLFNAQEDVFKKYQESFAHYKDYKNAPFPRFERATDLLIGSEGQLGIVTEVEFSTTENKNVTYMFINLPSWEVDYAPHIEFYNFVQTWRGKVLACELVDHNSMLFLPDEDKLGVNQDTIFLEILSDHVDDFFSAFSDKLKLLSENDLYELSSQRFHHIRASVPRRIFETNSRMGVVKMGTDVQVDAEHFAKLLDYYREAKKVGIAYNLFGHFGDAHLHFNFMPKPHEISPCKEFFHELYKKVEDWRGSPFAEHGIGLLKKDYIRAFHHEEHIRLFRYLKDQCDPHRQFFPQGFMNI